MATTVAAFALVCLYVGWHEYFLMPRVERFPDPIPIAMKNGPAPVDHHYEIATDLIGELPGAEFKTPSLAESASALGDRMDARIDNRAGHVLARLVTLGSTSNFRQSHRSIHLPTPASVTFKMKIPHGAILRGHFGLLPGQPGAATLIVDVNGKEVVSIKEKPLPRFAYDEQGWFYKSVYRLWNVGIEDRDARWAPFEADLSRFEGQEDVLTLRTESDAAKPVQAFVGAPAIMEKKEGAPRPFIVYLADACNTTYLGAYGSKAGLTPNIDAFAKDGALFKSFIAGGNWSRPGVMTMFTGSGATSLYIPVTPSRRKIHPAVRELFESSKGIVPLSVEFRNRHRYRTVAVVNNIFVDPSSQVGVDLGFDELTQTMRPEISTMDVEQFAARALAAHRDENVFLYIHQNAPNTADTPPRRFRKIARGAWDGKEHGLYRYLACLAQADFTFGRFLEMVRKIGWEDKAYVALSADHGQVLSKAHEIRTPDGPDDMRRALWFHGQTLYDEELRVPFIIRGPGIKGGAVFPRQIPSRSVPWILDELLKNNTGIFEPWMEPAQGIERNTDVVFAVGKESACVRVSDHTKYIRWENPRRLVPPGKNWVLTAVREELFDLADDPMETNNLVSTRPDLLGQMRELFGDGPRYPEFWALYVPAGTADKVVLSSESYSWKVLLATEATMTDPANYTVTIEPKGDLRLAAMATPGFAFKAVLLKDGKPLGRDALRFGPAYTLPPFEDGYDFPCLENTFPYTGESRYMSGPPEEYYAKYVPPAPDGVPHPHLCLMELDDWVAQTPVGGTMEAAIKDLLKQWGYVQ